MTTNADGRSDAPVLGPEAMRVGRYEFFFHVGAYFGATGEALPDPPFLDQVQCASRSPSPRPTTTCRSSCPRTATSPIAAASATVWHRAEFAEARKSGYFVSNSRFDIATPEH